MAREFNIRLYSCVVKHFAQSPCLAQLSSPQLSSAQLQVWNYGVIKKNVKKVKVKCARSMKNTKMFQKKFKIFNFILKGLKTLKKIKTYFLKTFFVIFHLKFVKVLAIFKSWVELSCQEQGLFIAQAPSSAQLNSWS